MIRRWLAVVLMVVLLPWHSAATAAEALWDEHGGELSHAVAHWIDEAHHHHDDGSLHQDDSQESRQHVQLDTQLNNAPVLPAVATWIATPLADESPPLLAALVPPEPFLEGLRRPPRFTR
ncbi:hypothetical protein [Caldimonas brevitalea]|uniref:Uncharacterized protein n=1 Tax=Caldimonas brevitalea TaxID=413882 RepID=A0A0G3BJ95_9BURK|nr:hypothetical protein [Caldimonas brevitalea]AKJ29447.1 hypothetical protein AAW51_2756 [Caldimonas brevitalea]